jgi:hypothetical protein
MKPTHHTLAVAPLVGEVPGQDFEFLEAHFEAQREAIAASAKASTPFFEETRKTMAKVAAVEIPRLSFTLNRNKNGPEVHLSFRNGLIVSQPIDADVVRAIQFTAPPEA